MLSSTIEHRAERHAALGDPHRLSIVDELVRSDRSPNELQVLVSIPSNLLAHHLDVLERVGLITRHRSSGDGRRRYVRLERGTLASLSSAPRVAAGPALFVCSHNSARSQLAAALWERMVGEPAGSAGTEPADRVHPGAVAAARRAGLDLGGRRPRALGDVGMLPGIVVTVCDRAHEALDPGAAWIHWSIDDPAADGSRAAFDRALRELRDRIDATVGERKAA